MDFLDDRDSEDVIMQHVSYHEHNYVEDEVEEDEEQQQQHNEDLHESHEPANERATEAAPDSDGDEQLEGDGQDDERPDDQDQDDERPSPVQESDDEMDTGAGYNHPMAYPKSYWPGSQRVGLEINPALRPYYEFPITQPSKRLRNNPRMLAAQKRQLQSHINQEFNLLNNQHQWELVEVTQHEHARLLKKKRSAGLSSDVLQYKVIRSRTVRNLKKRHRREANDTQRAALWAKNAQELKFLQDQLLD
ncbi:hypothetical protein BKA62DRAFT_821965 [Auriculariales sp. MPI-PUGE-AT-0066]|nr:hypothetical protein BKA62DRAFT_821965 [Auriculariales sp. MPI-PUGE-AT-0066]